MKYLWGRQVGGSVSYKLRFTRYRNNFIFCWGTWSLMVFDVKMFEEEEEESE